MALNSVVFSLFKSLEDKFTSRQEPRLDKHKLAYPLRSLRSGGKIVALRLV